MFVSVRLSCLVCEMGLITDELRGLCKRERMHTEGFNLLKEAVLTYYLLSLLPKQLHSKSAAP